MEKFKEKILNLKEYYFEKRRKILFYSMLSSILLCFCICSYFIFISYDEEGEIEEVSMHDEIVTDKENDENIKNIFVDIKGEVENPGVYEVSNGSRVIDIINVAGGLNKNSNTRYINLSKVVSDGDVIVIYSNEEIEEAKESDIIYVETPCVCEEINDSCIENNVTSENNLVNINTASVEVLMTLSGIGEVKANAIIEYRDSNGLFSSIEDLMNVDGISETIFNKIKENITV